MKIAVSIGRNYPEYKPYGEWIKSQDSEVEIFELVYSNYIDKFFDAETNLLECSALILAGGKDIEPARHGRGELNGSVSFNSARDAFEIELINLALKINLPILGICRGAQALNVALGGDLIVDIPSEIGNKVAHRAADGSPAEHLIELKTGSLIFKIIKESQGIVNSLHHEAVRNLPSDFIASAFSDDGSIEAFEPETYAGKSFLLGVQWHPEKMDWNSPFSKSLANHLILEAASYDLIKGKK